MDTGSGGPGGPAPRYNTSQENEDFGRPSFAEPGTAAQVVQHLQRGGCPQAIGIGSFGELDLAARALIVTYSPN